MKHIIVGGVPRSGKSILSNKLIKSYNLSRVPIDVIISSINNSFSELNINANSYLQYPEKTVSFLNSMLSQIENEKKFYYIFDSCFFTPKELEKYIDHPCFKVLFLGYPNVTIEMKLKYISSYAKENYCWMFEQNITIQEINERLSKYIQVSKKIQTECIKLGRSYALTAM